MTGRSIKGVKASLTRKQNALRTFERIEAGQVNHTTEGDAWAAERLARLRLGVERATQELRRLERR